VKFSLISAVTLALLCPLVSGQQELKIWAYDGSWYDGYGGAVALDGERAIVGARWANNPGNRSGAAYLHNAVTGAHLLELVWTNSVPGGQLTNEKFGSSVGIRGSKCVVGAPGTAGGGAAYIFDTATGTQITELEPSDVSSLDDFGYSVVISGELVVVSSPKDDENGYRSGSAYLFDATSGIELAKLVASDGTSDDNFGYALAMDGNTIVVGAPYASGTVWSGAVYLFDAITFAQTAKLLPSDGAGSDQFGLSVAISGTTILIGAPGVDDNGSFSGAAYLFDATTGAELAKLTASDGEADEVFGVSVGISGSTAIIGATRDDDNGFRSGSAYLFDVTTGAELVKILPSDGITRDGFGRVAIHAGTALVGAEEDDDNGPESGSAYLYHWDCNANGIPDLSEPDLNGNGIPDGCECIATDSCPTSPNTVGSGVQISITGIPSVSLNGLGFDATGGPSNQPGLFFHGHGAANQPFGEGVRCVSTPILRIPSLVFFDASGNTSKQLDMNANALSGIQPADTRYFQLWYRDPLGGLSGFNLSNGLEITFCP
jgi:hypothetical protein